MLLDAFSMRASDLHFEPYEHTYRVRFRIDGELREIASPPIAIKDKLASRIKVISKMDISEKRVPQDGKMKLKIGPNKVIDFRVSTLPTLFGEKIVIRILDPSSAKLGVDALGYEPEEKERLLEAIGRPYGMILVTGPTGSGKTVSLYTCLNLLNKPGVNIATAEDPSEINLPGVNQVNVNDKAGLTFAAALKSFPAPGSRHHHGRRDPRPGDRRHRHQGGPDRSPGAVDTAHQRCANDADADAQHGHRAIQYRIERDPDHGAAPGPAIVRELQGPVDIPEKALLDAGFKEERDRWQLDHLPAGRMLLCNGRLQGPRRHLPGDADFRRDPAHHPARRQRPGNRRAGRQGRRRIAAALRTAQGQARVDLAGRSARRHQRLEKGF
jgi:hypothetical protein